MIRKYSIYGLEIEGKRFDIAKTNDYVRLINLIYSSDLSDD